MKESRFIIIILSISMILIYPIFYVIEKLFPGCLDYINIATNLYCGLVVGIITAICQYCVAKRRIINTIYSIYLEIYRTYYYSKNNKFLFHYNASSIYKKIFDMGPKISEALDEYHGFFRKHDKLYKKLNPDIEIRDNYKIKNIIKTTLKWFNSNEYKYTVEPFIKEVEQILKNINLKRFEKDKEMMIKLFKKIY